MFSMVELLSIADCDGATYTNTGSVQYYYLIKYASSFRSMHTIQDAFFLPKPAPWRILQSIMLFIRKCCNTKHYN